ncbi:MAG TPA: hypothetical protein VGO50_00450 [Pyrinomonadaceae bacterium]|jgi:hypothetical protein|nr:hypothetical protein [Pyrinomonadaceae bacterium]
MPSHKNIKTNFRSSPEGGTGNASLTVKVEEEASYVELGSHMLAGQVFYLLDRDLSEILKENKNTIWGNLLKKRELFSDSARGENIREILRAPDHARKYPAALICTAEKLAHLTSGIGAIYAKALDIIRIQAVRIFVIDSQGKAHIDNLAAGTYYVCGVGETKRKSGVWNVRVELKPSKNSLRLDGKNMTGRRI